MKIRAAEIAAAKDVDTRLSTVDAVRILNAALKVRRARKQAKRERQRKEKDKQVVESVKPAGDAIAPSTDHSWTSLNHADVVKALESLQAPFLSKALESVKPQVETFDATLCGPVATPSQAPEWDGTFKAGEYQMRNGEKAIIDHIDGIHLCGKLSPDGLDCCFKWELSSGENNRVYAFDLIRPWPKGEQ